MYIDAETTRLREMGRARERERERESQGQCVTRDLDGNPISQSLLPAARVKSRRGRTYNILIGGWSLPEKVSANETALVGLPRVHTCAGKLEGPKSGLIQKRRRRWRKTHCSVDGVGIVRI